ncbi:cellulase family glycosylhydrolase [Kiritimatiellaeota bacterium B1221]|nr:cellulase family glycosylhydrolase [Kiritimatiellaeota bacterium B1221]
MLHHKHLYRILNGIFSVWISFLALYAGDFLLDLKDPEIRAAIEKQGAEVVSEGPGGKAAIKVVSSVEPGSLSTSGDKMVILPFDLTSFKGAKIEISGKVRGENISRPGHVYTGVKVQLHVLEAGGQQNWIDQGGSYGTFDWKDLSARAGIPQDALSATLALGLQECTGTVWISDVEVRRVEKAVVRPAPKEVNASTKLRGVMSPLNVDSGDFQDLKAWKVNLVRWQMFGVNEHLADFEEWFAQQLVKIQGALDLAEANGIGIIIDFHFLPGGREENGDARLFYDPQLQEQFVGYWEEIARRFKDHPALYAYDLMNEPVQRRESPEGVDNWYGLQVRTAQAVRKIDPKTFITFETDEWCNPNGYLTLEPLDLPGIIYQVHSYWPGGYTHQGIFTDQGIAKDVDSKESLAAYPGMISGQYVDKAALRKSLQPVRDFQLAYDVPIYAGEFSVVRWAPGGAQFLDDLISIFEEYGWDWTYHAFREYGGWSVEHENLPYDRDHHVKAAKPMDRQEVLMKWFRKNQPYTKTKISE